MSSHEEDEDRIPVANNAARTASDDLSATTTTSAEDDDLPPPAAEVNVGAQFHEMSQESMEEDREEEEDGAVMGVKNLAAEGTPEEMDTMNDDDEDSPEDEREVNLGEDDIDMDEAKDEEGVDLTTSNGNRPELASYSTRGRAHEENALDRLAAVGDLLSIGGIARGTGTGIGSGLPATALLSPETRMRETFLSDSLTEEERRTRTRHIPMVEGMHALRKQEIKSDLALARSTLGVGGTAERLAKSSKRKQADEDAASMGVESAALSGDDAVMSEEDRLAAGTKIFAIGSTDMVLPSPAFVAPSSEAALNSKRPTPREVDVVVAFNPPRPPESMGAKKKHRMLRWERRPADIEVDLSNYRKTVQRTREELVNAKKECERISTVDNYLRRHFLQHLKCLNDELIQVGDELATVQQECVDVADLPSSRTRTRGSVKGSSNAMRDVLHCLRAKGKEIYAKGLVIPGSSTEASKAHGAGGVSAISFTDWDRSTVIERSKLAQAWIVPGDRVHTPYGEGTVVAFYGPGALNAESLPRPDLFPNASPGGIPKEDTMEVDSNESSPQPAEAIQAKKKGLKASKTKETLDTSESLVNLLAPRVAVRLPYGVAFFNLGSVESKEDPSRYTDEQMAKRWIGIAETATTLGATVDVAAMASGMPREEDGDNIRENTISMDGANDEANVGGEKKRRLVPFGASLLPTAVGRGTNLLKANIAELDEAMDKVFLKGHGVLGVRDNPGVPSEIRKLEDQRQEHLILQAKVLQLRNQLYRQRRIRLLNERTYAASQERASRVESLVAEMRMDLKSLKNRLDLEIRDLDISEEQAENILKAYYMSLDSQHSGEATPPKRARRMSRMNDDMDATDLVPDAKVTDSARDGQINDVATARPVADK